LQKSPGFRQLSLQIEQNYGDSKILQTIFKISVDSEAEISEIAASVFNSGSLAQLVEHFTFNEGVDGSNPSRATKFKSRFCSSVRSHRLVA